jgi:hypothetical protein
VLKVGPSSTAIVAARGLLTRLPIRGAATSATTIGNAEPHIHGCRRPEFRQS